MDTTAHFYVGDNEVLQTKHSLDPWLLSAGIAYRF
jgi:outer membrane protein